MRTYLKKYVSRLKCLHFQFDKLELYGKVKCDEYCPSFALSQVFFNNNSLII
jgi:hypothetical protein